MSEQEAHQTNEGKLTRRKLLQGGGAGLCLLFLSNLLGCSPPTETEETDKQERPDLDDPRESILQQKKGFTNPTAARWFSEVDQDMIVCQLCPKQCELEDGERAPCRVRENREGVGYTLAYGNPALIQEDPIERKPFFHVLPGSRALSISTAGCNLDCKFCEVWDMALEYPENVYAHDVPPEKVIQHAEESNVQSVSYAFGEPVIFYEYMWDIAKLAKDAGFLNVAHTAGYIRPEPVRELAPLLDAANVDLKSFDDEFYRQVVGGELSPILDSLKILRDEGVHIEITNILIPDLNDNMDMIEQMCQWIADELGADIPLHFARFYPLYKLSELPRTPVSTMEEARDIALKAGLKFPYIARVSEHEGENTFCPGCGEKIIDRVGFVIDEMHIDNGRCAFCDAEIPGKWS